MADLVNNTHDLLIMTRMLLNKASESNDYLPYETIWLELLENECDLNLKLSFALFSIVKGEISQKYKRSLPKFKKIEQKFNEMSLDDVKIIMDYYSTTFNIKKQ